MKRLQLALIVCLASIVAACGSPTSSTASSTVAPPATSPQTTSTAPVPSTTTTSEPGFTVSLDITIGTEDKPGEFTATLSCGGTDSGTGYLADSAQAACDFLETSVQARTRLTEAPPADQVCDEIYGGGEVATITGSVDGEPVSATVDRANGCGIADWDLLRPVLVEPYDLLSQSCSAGSAQPRESDPQGDLPAVVSGLRDQLMELAASCDIDGLATLAAADSTEVSFGGVADAGAFWRDEENRGGAPMANLVTVLTFSPGSFTTDDGTVYYTWPGVFALDNWSDATAEQRQELAEVFGQDALDGWDEFGGYIGYRVGITGDGQWAYFIAGD